MIVNIYEGSSQDSGQIQGDAVEGIGLYPEVLAFAEEVQDAYEADMESDEDRDLTAVIAVNLGYLIAILAQETVSDEERDAFMDSAAQIGMAAMLMSDRMEKADEDE